VEDLKLHGMSYKDGVIDISLSGEQAKIFMGSLIEFFKQNGGENFLTLTVNDKDNNKFAINIQNCNGIDTPAEKLQRFEEKENKAFSIANNVIYFNDRSDYLSALYEVCKALKPTIEDEKIGIKYIGK
jgi:hypothetical protein